MRVDFEKTYLTSDQDQRWLRMMRGARAVAASLVIAGVGILTFSSTGRSNDGAVLDSTAAEYERGVATVGVPMIETAAPATRAVPAPAEEWKDPTLNPKETTGLLG